MQFAFRVSTMEEAQFDLAAASHQLADASGRARNRRICCTRRDQSII